MKTPVLRLLAAITLSLFLSACPETTVSDDFGIAPMSLKPAEWEGPWHPADDAEEVFTFRVRDAQKGMLELREATPKDTTKQPGIFTLCLRESGPKGIGPKLHFAILKDTSKPDEGTLHLLRRSDENVFLLWSINHDAVTAALKSGELQGAAKPDKDGAHNTLASDPQNYSRLLDPRFWNWSEPTTMLRNPRR